MRLTGYRIRDSFLPRLQKLHEELREQRDALNYLLYNVDNKPDPDEEIRLSDVGHAEACLKDVIYAFQIMR